MVEEVFRRVAVGIQGNRGFTPQALLVFVYEVLSDSIPQLAVKQKWVELMGVVLRSSFLLFLHRPKGVKTVDPKLRPPDSRLLPPTPGRSGPRPINLGNVGANIVTEFGLQVREL